MKMVTAADLMKKDLSAVFESDTVEDAIYVLHSHRLTGVPVVDPQWRLVGFFSESDVIRLTLPSCFEVLDQETFLFDETQLLNHHFSRIRTRPVAEYMQCQCFNVSPSTHIMNVADLMTRHCIKRIPVVENRRLVGVIDRSDFCEYLLHQAEQQ